MPAWSGGEREVEYADVIRLAVVHNPLDSPHDVQQVAPARDVKRFHRHQVYVGGDTLENSSRYAVPGHGAIVRDNAGHMSAVPAGIKDLFSRDVGNGVVLRQQSWLAVGVIGQGGMLPQPRVDDGDSNPASGNAVEVQCLHAGGGVVVEVLVIVVMSGYEFG